MTLIAVERWLHMSRITLLSVRWVAILYIVFVVSFIPFVACYIYGSEINRKSVLRKVTIVSGVPAAQGRHAEPHTYKTHAFIFVWSSSSVVNISRARTNARRKRRTTWRPYWLTYALLTSMQFALGDSFYGQLTTVKSRNPLVSTTWLRTFGWNSSRSRVFEADRWPGYGVSLDRGLRFFPKSWEQAKKPELRF